MSRFANEFLVLTQTKKNDKMDLGKQRFGPVLLNLWKLPGIAMSSKLEKALESCSKWNLGTRLLASNIDQSVGHTWVHISRVTMRNDPSGTSSSQRSTTTQFL